jgi:hypothetical protein
MIPAMTPKSSLLSSRTSCGVRNVRVSISIAFNDDNNNDDDDDDDDDMMITMMMIAMMTIPFNDLKTYR